MKTIKELIQSGIIAIGTKAKGNPDSVNISRFSAGIANKDYAAQTPFLWNGAYEYFGSDIRNIRLFSDPTHASEIFDSLRNDPAYIGGDIGVGYKNQVLDLLDDIDPLAKTMGAVNVAVKTRNGLKGYNTDGYGFAKSLEDVFKRRSESLKHKVVALFGAGGTANAIAFALAEKGVNLIILNRTVLKAKDLSDRINLYFGDKISSFSGRDDLLQKLEGVDAIVSIIDDPHSELDKLSVLGSVTLPLTKEGIDRNIAEAREVLLKLARTTVISDVMLRGHDTMTITQAKEMGFETLDGIPMVTNQAIEAFWLVNKSPLSLKESDKEKIAKIMRGRMI